MLHFTKMHGLGNDFIVIDAVSNPVSLSADEIRFLADRHFGVGCDQLLLVEPAESDQADFRYRIFNADGGEVGQCGNGARCFARFVLDQGLTDKKDIVVETMSGCLALHLDDAGLVTVDMGAPRFDPQDIPFDAPQQAERYTIEVAGEQYQLGAVSVGNPHAVLTVDDVTIAPVETLGPVLEQHERFPQRVNVGFMEIIDRSRIRLRVYERGTGETLACGSGACAAVVVGQRQGLLDDRVLVELAGGSLLIQCAGGKLSEDQGGDRPSVSMTGPANRIFEGEIEL